MVFRSDGPDNKNPSFDATVVGPGPQQSDPPQQTNSSLRQEQVDVYMVC